MYRLCISLSCHVDVECPNCFNQLRKPFPSTVKTRYDELFTNANVPLDPLLSYELCKLHELEHVVKPQGIAKGYPTNIDFEKMAERVTALLPSLALFMKRDGGSHFLLAQKHLRESMVPEKRSPLWDNSRNMLAV
ncbi:hypothetical protein BCR43DRAFT_217679 [Syncephalastrum racemosum]|uniref:Uncharacterized protein n=1 Tax=Syncephalastrum racemosum TaxID=13706 RepID=A0A1X2HKG3_SYNRA|nr:hypothetical protein BCR43DRAFT_217679 [Syncephalastrum racemosum]